MSVLIFKYTYMVLLCSTTTLNVPDPAERKYKEETVTLTVSSTGWLCVFVVLAVVVALLSLSLVALR